MAKILKAVAVLLEGVVNFHLGLVPQGAGEREAILGGSVGAVGGLEGGELGGTNGR